MWPFRKKKLFAVRVKDMVDQASTHGGEIIAYVEPGGDIRRVVMIKPDCNMSKPDQEKSVELFIRMYNSANDPGASHPREKI